MSCDAKIRPLPDDTELVCDLSGPHGLHESTLRDYAYPGSATVISWYEDDRRTFRGDWVACPAECILPAGHQGRHAP